METSAPNPDRRLCRRRTAKAKARITCKKGLMDLGPNLALALLDFSESGVRLITKTAVVAGDEVSIVLETTGSDKPVRRAGTVGWVVPTDARTFCVGVEFQKRLGYTDLQNLI